MSLSQVTERQAGSPRSSRQPQGKQSAPPPYTTPPLHQTASPPPPPPRQKERQEGAGGGKRCSIVLGWATRSSPRRRDYARVTIRVGTPLQVRLIQMMLAVWVRVSVSCLLGNCRPQRNMTMYCYRVYCRSLGNGVERNEESCQTDSDCFLLVCSQLLFLVILLHGRSKSLLQLLSLVAAYLCLLYC